MTPDLAARIALLQREAEDLDTAADLAASRGLRETAKYHRAEAQHARDVADRLRGELLTASARAIDAYERACLDSVRATLKRCIEKRQAEGREIPDALLELDRYLSILNGG